MTVSESNEGHEKTGLLRCIEKLKVILEYEDRNNEKLH